MPVYTETIIDKKTGKKVDKIIDGKKQYFIRTYIVDENGNRKQITRHNKNWIGRNGYWLAQQEENRLKSNIVIRSDIPKKRNITLGQLKSEYLEHLKGRIDNDTLSRKKDKLNHFCEKDKTKQILTYPNKNIRLFDKNAYQIWQNQMKNKYYFNGSKKKKYSIKYLNSIHNEICRMIDYAVIEGFCNVNFARQTGKIGTPKEVRLSNRNKCYEIINYEEYISLLKASEGNLKYNTYFDLSFSRGPRIGEIRAFQLKDYNPQKKQLMVNHTMSKKNELKEPKTAASKAPIDLDDSVNEKIAKLVQYWKQFDRCNENWFIFNGPTPISSNALEHAKEKYFKLANINKHIRPHDFRHSCATWLFSIDTNVAVISQILRHANINETLKTYTHLLKENYNDEMKKINAIKMK